MSTPVITVFGSTGAQGGGLARALLADPQRRFAVRAVTRKPDGAAAQALARAGAAIVVADLDDAASVAQALAGSHGAFFVTNFWEHFSPARELSQAQHMAQGAARAGVQHAIWSTLEDTRRFFPADGRRMPVLQGKYNVPHFDAKGEADALFQQAGVPTTLLFTSFYWDNLIHFGMGPKRGADGKLVFTLPMRDAPMPGIAAEDIGRCAAGVFFRGKTLVGQSVGIAGEHPTGAQMAATLGRVLGEPVSHYSPDWAEYRGYGFPGADDLGNMFQFYTEFAEPFCAARSVARSRELNPQLQDFAQWAAANAARIPRG